jgi:hypothetical protein
MSHHLPNPRWINMTVDGDRVKLSAKAAEALRSSEEDGTLVIPWSLNVDSRGRVNGANPEGMFTRAGWAVQSDGRLRLTAAGLKVRDALRAYDERKQQALTPAALYEYRDPNTEHGTVMLVQTEPPRNDDQPAVGIMLFEDANVLDVSLNRSEVTRLRARLGRWLNEEATRVQPE